MNADTREQMFASLREEEGYRGKPYKCSTGHWTVGYGTTFPITKAEAAWLLVQRADGVMSELDIRLAADHDIHFLRLPEMVQRALVEIAYQVGVSGLMRFRRMLQAVRVGNWVEAHDEALDSRWARQTPGRAKRMAYLLLNGTTHPGPTGTKGMAV